MKEQPASHRTLENIFYSAAGYALPILFSIFITPVIVHKLGVAEYGVLVLLNTLYGFLALVDLGLGTALIKYVSAYHAQGDDMRLRNMINSANVLFLITGLIGALIFVCFGFFALPWFHIQASMVRHTLLVFALAGVVFFLNNAMQSYAIIISALQRYDISVRLSLGQLTAYNGGILIVVLLGHGLSTIYIINIITTIALAMLWYIHARRLLPQLHFGFTWVREEIVKAYKFGLLAAVSTFSNSALSQLDRLLIPLYTGPVQLSYYSLPGSVAQKSSGLTSSAGNILFPLTSALESVGDKTKIYQLYRRGFRNITFVAAALCSSIAVFRYEILQFWLGRDFANTGSNILLILTVTYFILSVYAPLTNFLLGLGHVRFLTFASLGLAALNLVLLLMLLPVFGITGAAWAFLGGVLPVPFIFFWTERHILHLRNIGMFYFKLYGQLFITTALFCLTAHYFLLPLVHSLASLLVVGVLSVCVYVGLYFILGFVEKDDQALGLAFARGILRRILGQHGGGHA